MSYAPKWEQTGNNNNNNNNNKLRKYSFTIAHNAATFLHDFTKTSEVFMG
jgi:hypothetical protein